MLIKIVVPKACGVYSGGNCRFKVELRVEFTPNGNVGTVMTPLDVTEPRLVRCGLRCGNCAEISNKKLILPSELEKRKLTKLKIVDEV